MKISARRMIAFLIALVVIAACAPGKKGFKKDTQLLDTIDKTFAGAADQYTFMMTQLATDRFPKTWDPKTAKLMTSGSDWWCSGFYPGTLLYLYEQTKDPALYTEALRILKLLEKEKNNKTTHDLGFMMYCSFGNANRIAPQPAYNEILMTSARSLASRFNPTVGCIKSWDSKAGDYLVIIDNMMNLELLFWATRYSGDSSFYRIAVTHANTTMKNHFRPDYSSYHVLNYNAATGAVQQKRTAQGYSDASAWARGQAWGLYGYTVMYRETKDKKYLDHARGIAGFILNHPNLPSDKIPYWDFNDPAIPNALRDASAGAVMASALMELSTYVDNKEANRFFRAGETMIRSLSSAPYISPVHANGGFILQHAVGHMPQKTEVDVPLTYADYYFVEALSRYKNAGTGRASVSTTQHQAKSAGQTGDMFHPGAVWKDENGEVINAHGGGLLTANNKYYWFGEKRGRRTSEGVQVYSSNDLYHWHPEGLALAPDDVDTASEIARGCLMERPKVIYNRSTGKYVLWFHLELKGKGYQAARAGVAVSDQVTGPYRYLGSFRPNGNMSRDMTLFVDEDGKAYHIYSSRDNYDLRMVELTSDYLHASGKDSLLFSNHREAPAIFKNRGKYFLITSGCTGWKPNEASLHMASSIWGPWKPVHENPMKGPGADSTYGGQSTFVLPVAGRENSFIFMADRWNPRDLKDSRYLWLPVKWKDQLPYVEWLNEWSMH
jgi:unsaturated chondroitin disaccharide hydrolase